MAEPALRGVSVIVCSQARPRDLQICLAALERQTIRGFQTVVVADAPGRGILHGASDLTVVAYDTPNIGAARNVGLHHACGEIVAFIDDDATAYPDWLERLIAPFAAPDVAAVGGTVIGRNGFSLQWGPRLVDGLGRHVAADPDGAGRVESRPGFALRTEGTNMAFRRAALDAVGGFDPGFAFYMDETDLNMRMTAAGFLTVHARDARVHHRQAPSRRRDADRLPLDLFDIGRSVARFVARHAPPSRRRTALRFHLGEQRARLERLVTAGRMTQAAASDRLREFRAGLRHPPDAPEAAGRAPLRPPAAPSDRLSASPAGRRAIRLWGWWWQRTTLLRMAEGAARDGHVVHLLLFSPTTRFHRRRMVLPGIWLQTGGLFGRSLRSDPIFAAWTAAGRARREWSLPCAPGREIEPFAGGPVDCTMLSGRGVASVHGATRTKGTLCTAPFLRPSSRWRVWVRGSSRRRNPSPRRS